MAEMSLWIPVAAAFAGGGLVGFFDIVKDHLNRKTEERRHLRELMFNAAVENWKHNNTVAIELMKVGNKVELMPLDSYIVTLIALSDSLLSSALTKDNVAEKLKGAYEIAQVADKFIKDANR
jgi:hypothetical protein